MPLILRTIRKAKWYRNDPLPWLSPDELQADALVDLNTKGNALSVYLVKEDDAEALERLVTALAANRDSIKELDYALFADDILSEIGIKISAVGGNTPDSVVNTWHRDLTELSASKIMRLADAIRKGARIKRIPGKRIRGLIIDALAANRVDRAKLRLGADVVGDLEGAVLVVKDRPN